MKTILGVVSMVSIELTVLVSISLSEISFDFSRPFDEFLVLDFCEYLGDESVKRGSVNSGWQRGVRGRLSLVCCLKS